MPRLLVKRLGLDHAHAWPWVSLSYPVFVAKALCFSITHLPGSKMKKLVHMFVKGRTRELEIREGRVLV